MIVTRRGVLGLFAVVEVVGFVRGLGLRLVVVSVALVVGVTLMVSVTLVVSVMMVVVVSRAFCEN